MYGTIARITLKPGTLPALQRLYEQVVDDGRLAQAGHIGGYMYQTDADPNVIFMVTIFESKEAYRKNAESPAQHEQFMRMSEFFAAPPEWNDGEIIWSKDRRLA